MSKRQVNQGEEDLAALPDNNAVKFMSMFERRAKKGQCVNQPYLGCREFAADFRLAEDSATQPSPIDETRDLGWMLYDLDYSNSTDPKPLFFRASMKNGIIVIPDQNSEGVRG